MGMVCKHGRDYLYTSRWVNGRVVTTVHSGPLLEQHAQEWEDELQRSRERRRRRQVARAVILAEERKLDGLAREARALVAATLEAAGWHRHDRGAWRKQRTMTPNTATPPLATQDTRDDLDRRIADRLRVASSSAAEAKRYFDEVSQVGPTGLDLLLKMHDGNLASANENLMIGQIEAKDLLRREAIRRKLVRLRDELAGASPVSAIERLLIERISAAWLAVQHAEHWFISVLELDLVKPGTSAFEDKRLARAEKRLVGLLRDLDQVRRKLPPSHHLHIRARGDVRIGEPALAEPPPPAIDVTPELGAMTAAPTHPPLLPQGLS